MSLPDLPNVTKLSPYVTRILGQNPGRYTLQGTNTYLISDPSDRREVILLDTAQGIPSYLEHLSPLIGDEVQKVTVVLSHWHEDHVGGLEDVLTLIKGRSVVVWKYPTTGQTDEDQARDKAVEERVERFELGRAGAGENSLVPGGKIKALREGQVLNLGAKVELQVVHTPGHTSDSISIVLRTNAEEGGTKVFTFDTILGHGTAVFEDLGAYMGSLGKLLEVSGSDKGEEVELYPGHGETIKEGRGKIEEYRRHRQEREDQVVQGLRKEGKNVQALDLTEGIYADTIPDELKPAATRGLLLHLEKLEKEGQVERTVAVGEEAEDAPLPGWNDYWRWIGGAEETKGSGGAAKI